MFSKLIKWVKEFVDVWVFFAEVGEEQWKDRKFEKKMRKEQKEKEKEECE